MTGIFSGCYPAIYTCSLRSVNVLKPGLKTGYRKNKYRDILIVLQFSVSIVFIASTFLVYEQLNFLKGRELGFNKDHLISIKIQSNTIRRQYQSVKTELRKNPNVLNVSASDYFPGENCENTGVICEGALENEYIYMNAVKIDWDFLDTYKIKLAAGRNFSPENTAELNSGYLINESALKRFNWDSPENAVGKELEYGSYGRAAVIGIVENFNFRSLHHDVDPLILHFVPRMFEYITVRINSVNLPGTIEFLKETWKKFDPYRPVELSFVDESFEKLYKSEEKTGKIFGYITCLVVFIACLGLFGLISFITEQKTKEIGIRKVMGASSKNIVLLISKVFLKLVLIAGTIAFPISWYFMNNWLNNFAHRISGIVWIFLISAVIAVLIALITVSFKSFKAAAANPVDSLRYE